MIYPYSCRTCSSRWEEEQSMSSAPSTLCPKCGAQEAYREIRSTEFCLRGGGWAVDGYALQKKQVKYERKVFNGV